MDANDRPETAAGHVPRKGRDAPQALCNRSASAGPIKVQQSEAVEKMEEPEARDNAGKSRFTPISQVLGPMQEEKLQGRDVDALEETMPHTMTG